MMRSTTCARTFNIHTAPNSFAFFFKQFAIANRAIIWENEFLFTCRFLLQLMILQFMELHLRLFLPKQYHQYLRSFSFMYSSLNRKYCDSNTANMHRVQFCNRSYSAGSSHLEFNLPISLVVACLALNLKAIAQRG